MIAVLVDAWIKVMREDQVTQRPQWFQNVKNVWTYSIPQAMQGWLGYKSKKSDQANIKRSNGLVQNPRQWADIYPAGCPRRKLANYLKSNYKIESDEIDDIVKCVDKDTSGTIEWKEIQKVLLDIQPTVEGRVFSSFRRTIDKIESLKHDVYTSSGDSIGVSSDAGRRGNFDQRLTKIEKQQEMIMTLLQDINEKIPQ